MVKVKSVYLHIFSWILFALLPVLFIRAGSLWSGPEWMDFLKGHLVRSMFIVFLFYLNYLQLVPQFLLRRRQLLFVIWNTIALMLIFYFIGFLHEINFILPPGVEKSSRTPPGLFNPLLLTMIIGIGMAIGVALYRKLKFSEQKKTEVELAYMKSRLNPHFLFNTLNSVYALAVKRSEDTAEAVSRLSSIMRYLITDTGSNKVELEKELTYINDFIELQRLRLTEKTKVDFRLEGITAGKYIVPLLLIAFVENAFKYGVSTEVSSDIQIYIFIKGDDLQLHVNNAKALKKSADLQGEGLGLTSSRQLLDHFYKDRYLLQISDEEDKFKVELTLQLT